MPSKKWFYEFYCENCGNVLATAEHSSIHLVLGFETLCQECGASCGSSHIFNTGVKKVCLRRKPNFKWYNPFTWGYEREVEE